VKYDRDPNYNHLYIKNVRFVSRRLLIEFKHLVLVNPVSKTQINAANRQHDRNTPTVQQHNRHVGYCLGRPETDVKFRAFVKSIEGDLESMEMTAKQNFEALNGLKEESENNSNYGISNDKSQYRNSNQVMPIACSVFKLTRQNVRNACSAEISIDRYNQKPNIDK